MASGPNYILLMIYRSQLQYLIRWTGYDVLTWEPAKFVDGLQAVDEFHQR